MYTTRLSFCYFYYGRYVLIADNTHINKIFILLLKSYKTEKVGKSKISVFLSSSLKSVFFFFYFFETKKCHSMFAIQQPYESDVVFFIIIIISIDYKSIIIVFTQSKKKKKRKHPWKVWDDYNKADSFNPFYVCSVGPLRSTQPW